MPSASAGSSASAAAAVGPLVTSTQAVSSDIPAAPTASSIAVSSPAARVRTSVSVVGDRITAAVEHEPGDARMYQLELPHRLGDVAPPARLVDHEHDLHTRVSGDRLGVGGREHGSGVE